VALARLPAGFFVGLWYASHPDSSFQTTDTWHLLPTMLQEPLSTFPPQEDDFVEDECGPVERELREAVARFAMGPVAIDRVAPSPIRWLWPGRIPLGALTLLAGDPGVGKSLLTLDLAARVSRGAPWPDQAPAGETVPSAAVSNPQLAHSPGSVLLLTAEDDLADTIRPRLEAAGADCSRIVAQPMLLPMSAYISREAGILRGFELRGNVSRLQFIVRDIPDCRLLVIDSMNIFLSDNTERSKNALPAVLLRLAGLARERELAVVVISHFRKKEGMALHRTLGSLAFVATARVAWAVTRDPDVPSRRLLLPIKSNLLAGTSGLAFTIESAPPDGVPKILWLPAAVDTTANVDMLHALPRGRPDDERQQAKSWLLQRLAAGPCAVKEIQIEADANGFSRHTLRRAFRELHGKATKDATANGPWFWQLPVEDAQKSEGDFWTPSTFTDPANAPVEHPTSGILPHQPPFIVSQKASNIIVNQCPLTSDS
jgi:hypothetical protein